MAVGTNELTVEKLAEMDSAGLAEALSSTGLDKWIWKVIWIEIKCTKRFSENLRRISFNKKATPAIWGREIQTTGVK